jgi:hypothetical protein
VFMRSRKGLVSCVGKGNIWNFVTISRNYMCYLSGLQYIYIYIYIYISEVTDSELSSDSGSQYSVPLVFSDIQLLEGNYLCC